MKLKHFDVGIWCNKSSRSLFFLQYPFSFLIKIVAQIWKKKTFCWWAGKSEPGSFQRVACQGGIAGLDVLIQTFRRKSMLRKTAERLHQVFFLASILEQANGKLIHVFFLSLGPHYGMQHLTPGDCKEAQTEIISKYAVNQEPAKIRKVFFHFKPRPDSSGHPAWRAWGAAIRSDLVGQESVQQIQRRYDVSAGYQPHILLAVSLAMMLNFTLPKFSSGFLTFWWFFVVLKTYSSCLTLLDTWRQNLRRTAWELTWSLQQCSFCSFLL